MSRGKGGWANSRGRGLPAPGAMRPPDAVTRGPLRKIVERLPLGYYQNAGVKPLPRNMGGIFRSERHLLECGHLLLLEDRAQFRRRCRKCRDGRPRDVAAPAAPSQGEGEGK
jgi:hypothetical protein